MASDFKPDCEGRIKAATISAADPDAVVKSYKDFFGYEVIHESIVSAAEAESWGAPGMEGKRQFLTGPSSGTQVFLRVVENDEVADYRPLKTFGWNAVEITVTDVEELDRRLQNSPFEIIGPPAYLDFSDRIYPMQAVGQAQEVFYLNQVRGDLPDYDLPLARSFVDQIFIMILASKDMNEAISFYTEKLGWKQGNAYFTKYSVINNAFGLPEETPHHLSMTCVGRDVNNEVDQYPEGTVERSVKPGMLPPAIAMVSYNVTSLDTLDVDFLSPPARFEHAPYNGRRAATCVGKAGELIELIEIE
jgi:catechol 2,3-dioxygenase-like lactoylglutathione lyase family enzyme